MALLVAAHLFDLARSLAWVFVALIALEVVTRAPVSWSSRLRAAALWAVYIVPTAVLLSVCDAAMRELHVRPLLPALPIGGLWGSIITAVIGVVIADFCFYWCHRAQHRWFWRSHAVHHSLRELSALNSYLHWSEQLLRIPLVVVPAVLLTPSGAQMALIAALLPLQNHLAHSPTWLSLGRFRWTFVDNRYHRIHHSLEAQHFDKNFAQALPLWDVLFGTAYFPQPDEWPDTGLADQPEPDGLVDYLIRPFRPLRGHQIAEQAPDVGVDLA